MNLILQNVTDRLARRSAILIMTLCAAVIFIVAVVGTAMTSDDHPAKVAQTHTTAVHGISGFSNVGLAVTPANGQAKTFCAALAQSADQQSKGLMHQSGFGGLDAMAFTFGTDTDAAFYMANVTIPLSVAFFDGTGNFISSSDMEPCTIAADQCPRYRATAAYRVAVETPRGGLANMGIGQGSNVTVGGPCS